MLPRVVDLVIQQMYNSSRVMMKSNAGWLYITIVFSSRVLHQWLSIASSMGSYSPGWFCITSRVWTKQQTNVGELGGGFKYFLCSPLFGEDFQSD